MKTAFILAFILLLLSFHSNAQQTIDKLNVNQLKLPKESANKALILDGAGQVKSSSTITDTELGYLEGLSDTLVNLLSGKANDSDVVKLSGNQSVDGVKTFTGKLVASSTVNGSIPCPVMTEAQRDLFTPVEGDCVYNSNTLKLNVFDGSVWKDVGGAGGISLWLTANPYNVNDIVIESDKIYRCLIAHTSGVFATDLGAGNWGEVSQGLTSPVALADGGTGLSITPVAGSIVYVDADSFEQLAPGSAGQILQSNGSSAPSWVDKTEYVSPNNLETPISSTQILLESGNKNILTNPSFENTTFESGGWVNSAGVFTENFANKVDGAKSARLVLSSQIMSLSQSSVLYQSSFADGVQGLASVWLKSDVALKVCAVQAGVVSTSLCVDVQANNKWGLYKVPFILGATSNGISIASTGAVTGTVYIDDAFVGAVDLKVDGQAINSQSSLLDQTANFGTAPITGALTASSGSGLYSYNSVTGVYTVLKNSTITISVAGAASSASAVIPAIYVNGVLRSLCHTPAATDQWCETSYTNKLSAGDYFSVNNAQGTMKAEKITVSAIENASTSTYSSTNSDTDWASCGHTAASFTGLGSVTNILTQCKRQGSDLLMKGSFTVGTPTAVEARLSLPTWNGVQLVSAGSSVIPSLQLSGDMIYSASSTINFRHATLIEPSVSYMTFAYQSSTNAGYQKILGTTMTANNQNFSFSSRIPIEGWQNSNIIIGQFNGLESCTSTLECTDTFSAKISAAGVVSGENVDWINGNCSSGGTGFKVCSFNTNIFTVAPNCQMVSGIGSTGNFLTRISASSSSSATFLTMNTVATPVDGPFEIICQKQGVDYVGKTAKAVASDQNLRTPGVTKGVVYSAKISSGGLVSDELGDFINNNCTATSPYTCTFNSNIFTSVNCNCSVTGTTAVSCRVETLNTSSSVIRVISGTPSSVNDSFALNCHGVSP